MLKRIGLINFKAFACQELALEPLTLLTGLNSSGKSTVLQALALLRQSNDAGILGPHSATGESGLLLNGELVELGTGQDVRHESYLSDDPDICISLADGDASHTWRAVYGTEDDLLLLRRELPEEDLQQAIPTRFTGLFGTGFQYLKADRITPAVSYPRSRHAVVTHGSLGARGEHTVNYLRTNQDQLIPNPSLAREEEPSLTLLPQVEAWLQCLCPGVNLEAIGIDGTGTVRLSYGFGMGASASNRYRPTNVGFGLTYALPVVVACLAAEAGSLILLENPEAHLHPQGQTWLAHLACAAAAAGVQVVMETHSDHVLNGLRLSIKNGRLPANSAAVHYFRRSNLATEVISPRIDNDGMLSDWPQGFFDEWESSLEKLLD